MRDQHVSLDREEVEQCIKALKDVPGIQAVYTRQSTNLPELQVVWVRTQEDLYMLGTPRQLVLLKVKLHWEQWWQHVH